MGNSSSESEDSPKKIKNNEKYDYLDTNNYIYIIIGILMKDGRKLYVGIIFVFLSFIIYFIDGASV